MILPDGNSLFTRVASILDQARGKVVRSVNSNMVLAYWLIGREIVQELQGGEERAAYGRQLVEDLSAYLTERYGKGYSAPTLWNFRQFYLVYADRLRILSPSGRELVRDDKLSLTGRETKTVEIHCLEGENDTSGFSPFLTWSHYRALMRVSDEKARHFYEREAIECGWNKAQLERQIHSSYYHRILANRGEIGLIDPSRERLPGKAVPAATVLKSPYVRRSFQGARRQPDHRPDPLFRQGRGRG
jgi:hypothetical protein